MKVNEVISKLRVMLGAETEEVIVTETRLEEEEKVEVKMYDATLIDGTEVYTEGELAAGSTLYVKVEEGEAPFAPEGMHETTEGFLITVGENGEIVSIEEKAAEAVEVESTEEEKVEVEMEEEETKEEAFDVEGLVDAIAEILQPQTVIIEELKEKLATLEARFEAVADEPAAKPIKNTFSESNSQNNMVARLAQIRRGK